MLRCVLGLPALADEAAVSAELAKLADLVAAPDDASGIDADDVLASLRSAMRLPTLTSADDVLAAVRAALAPPSAPGDVPGGSNDSPHVGAMSRGSRAAKEHRMSTTMMALAARLGFAASDEGAAGRYVAARAEESAEVRRSLGLSHSAEAKDVAAKRGIQIVFEQNYPPSTVEFSAIVRALKAAKPDMVYIASYPPDSAGLLRAINEIGVGVAEVSAGDVAAVCFCCRRWYATGGAHDAELRVWEIASHPGRWRAQINHSRHYGDWHDTDSPEACIASVRASLPTNAVDRLAALRRRHERDFDAVARLFAVLRGAGNVCDVGAHVEAYVARMALRRQGWSVPLEIGRASCRERVSSPV